MSLRYMAVDDNSSFHDKESVVLAEKGLYLLRVMSMDEGIKNAAKERFLFIVINSDNIGYLPKLSILKGIAKVPVLVVTSDFSTEENAKALGNGADAFGLVGVVDKSIKAIVDKPKIRTDPINDIVEVILSRGILILPDFGKVFIGELEVFLSTLEIRVLSLLLNGDGRIFSCEQIFNNVFDIDRDIDSEDSIKSAIKRIRNKTGKKDIIKNVWGRVYRIGSV